MANVLCFPAGPDGIGGIRVTHSELSASLLAPSFALSLSSCFLFNVQTLYVTLEGGGISLCILDNNRTAQLSFMGSEVERCEEKRQVKGRNK